MTPPLKLVAGPWEQDKIMRTRTLRYGTSRHGFEVTGLETHHAKGYIAVITEPKRIESEPFKFSWQAHKWFLEQARSLV